MSTRNQTVPGRQLSRRQLIGAAAGVAIAGSTLTPAAAHNLPRSAAARPLRHSARQPASPIQHFVCMMQEGHSFDTYFGTYPGVDGIQAVSGVPVDPTDPASPVISPFWVGERHLEKLSQTADTFARQFNAGKLDGFISAITALNQDGTTALGYFDDRDIPYYWNLADEFTLFDRFFSAAAASPYLNRLFWLTGSQAGLAEGTSASLIPQDTTTIFDRLEAAGVSWKFYVQHYKNARDAAGTSQEELRVPLLGLERFRKAPLASKIVDLEQYFRDLEHGDLPEVAYVATSASSERTPVHPRSSQRLIQSMLNELARSSHWDSTAFMLTYDGWGGWFDHVVPPRVDQFGLGFRVPALLVGAHAQRGRIDSTVRDCTAALRLIEENWGIEPLGERDANAASLLDTFDFASPPRAPMFVSSARNHIPLKQPRRELVYLAYAGAIGLGASLIAAAMALPQRGNGKEPAFMRLRR